jgi:hypothetical protein
MMIEHKNVLNIDKNSIGKAYIAAHILSIFVNIKYMNSLCLIRL